jgi:hypothetical protein
MSASSLSSALVEAQRAVDVAGKDATNLHHRYDYASAEEIVSVASVALAGAGLAFSESSSSFEPFGAELLKERQAAKGKAHDDGVGGALGLLSVRYKLVHGATGEEDFYDHVFPVCPEKGRPLDKALAASRTECLSYALRGLLLIERRPRDQAGKAKGKRKAPPLDVSGRADPSVQRAAPAPTVSPEPASRSPRPEGAPEPTPAQIEQAAEIAAILNAPILSQGLTALAMARRNRALDPLAVEKAFASFMLRKIQAAREAKKLDWLVDAESYLARAGLGADANRAPREALRVAMAELRGAP